jgi:hypothetical protein
MRTNPSAAFAASVLLSSAGLVSLTASAATVTNVCTPKITADKTIATAAQRKHAGSIAEPPLTDTSNGFAWPDTPLGVVKLDSGYAFFGSDGGFHAIRKRGDEIVGNDKYGSITRTRGTIDDILGTEPPVDVTIRLNPDPDVNPFYGSYDYMGGGPVYRVPRGRPGEGNLLMVYHAEIPTIATQSFYSILALAASTDEGRSWTDLGEIVRLNQAYRTDLDGYDIGDSNLVPSPDGKDFYIFFSDLLANGSTHWNNAQGYIPDTITVVSIARAPIDRVLEAAFGKHPHALPFAKRYDGWNLQQGLGGYSRDQNPEGGYNGSLQVAWNADLHRYQEFINQGVLIAYAESSDGLSWSQPTILRDFRQDPDQPSIYDAPMGAGEDPSILGKAFYILYTRSPAATGWNGASVHRLDVSCP